MTQKPSPRERWNAMAPWQRTGTVVLGVLEIVATTAAVVDLARRPAGLVRGPKALWWPALVVQPFGPLAYLLLGRRED
ncbi:PLDc N-terminal domain-containing protein [Actinoplanes sp. KI2]|uniref:PLDc N-terminal domain-containing protein n=1 Tax=Actinoplanes sp. KI2 TaxID=2983315 RepID=UPI0021D5A377|nr:PLDc N-terminal domain-containing protein [Actinoplanes sp. KI2]MCU7725666.1 PLDc N-terminal domain-containing protein [Actinoplanes sp. KI2]